MDCDDDGSAVVGAAGSLSKNLQLLKEGKISQQDAAIDVTKETAGAGLATAFSAAVVGAVGGGLVVSLGVAVTAAVAGKYAPAQSCSVMSEGRFSTRL